jgi:hypothetical protein
MSLLLIVGWGVLLILALVYALGMVGSERLRKAREQYARVQREHGTNAPYHCPHAFVSLSRDAESGLGRKWCRVCGKHVGTAARRRSWFGSLRRDTH